MFIGAGASNGSNFRWQGAIDEVRIWNLAQTERQIRENMHLTLKGNETGLVAYYQFNKDSWGGTAYTVLDAMGNHHGSSINMEQADRVASEVAVAGGVSQTITVGTTGLFDFDEMGLSINFGSSPNGEIVVSRLETEKPTGWSGVSADVDNEYFVVCNYGSNPNPQVNRMVFEDIGYLPSTTSIGDLSLYKRNSRAFGNTWANNLGNPNTIITGAAATIDFSAAPLTTGFSQFVIVSNDNALLPIDLSTFEVKRINITKVALEWAK